MQNQDPAPKIERTKEVLKTFDEYLVAQQIASSGSFVAETKELSLADISIHFTLDYLKFNPNFDTTPFPNVVALNERIAAALKQYQPDGLFDNAIVQIKKLVEQMQLQQQQQK